MGFLLTCTALIFMYLTFQIAQETWQNKKFASVFIALMACCFPILLVLLLKK